MTKNKIQDLRNHLFETIEMLKEGDIDIDRALAISKVSHAIIETAKVEVSYMKTLERTTPSKFLESKE